MRSWTNRPTALSASAVTTAASIPKQRLSPRATLYSPPPSQTLKWRVVAIRASPGSRRSMTSPRLTMSQRQSFFSLTTKSLIDFYPQKGTKSTKVIFLLCAFCAFLWLKLSWLELWRQQVKHEQRREICGGADDKHR